MPTKKVGAGLLAGAISVVLVWGLKTYAHAELPNEVASAVTMILTFITSYFVSE